MSEPLSILVVDDDVQLAALLRRQLEYLGCAVTVAGTIGAGRLELERARFDLALVDYRLPDGEGHTLVRAALGSGRAAVAYCMTGEAHCKNVVEAMRAGATDVLEKPFAPERVRAIVDARRAAATTDLAAWRRRYAPELLGEERALTDVLRVIHSVADTACTVLVTGESGTGKEEVARALHQASGRRDQRFVALNCAAIPETLLEAELFGHARGAFTGAVQAREGRIAQADGGTLFLDEIGDMPLSAQTRLLRVLQDHAVTPIGGDRAQQVNVRVVAATNRDLEAMVEAGTFRADLYYRLSVICVELPPLRERPGDVALLARHFIGRANRKNGREVAGLTDEAAASLSEHRWPGNVRELYNVIERAVVIKRSGVLGADDLTLPRRGRARLSVVPAPAAAPEAADGDSLHLRTALDGVEKKLITEALGRTGGNRTEAAALLGLNRSTLVEKLRKLGG